MNEKIRTISVMLGNTNHDYSVCVFRGYGGEDHRIYYISRHSVAMKFLDDMAHSNDVRIYTHWGNFPAIQYKRK